MVLKEISTLGLFGVFFNFFDSKDEILRRYWNGEERINRSIDRARPLKLTIPIDAVRRIDNSRILIRCNEGNTGGEKITTVLFDLQRIIVAIRYIWRNVVGSMLGAGAVLFFSTLCACVRGTPFVATGAWQYSTKWKVLIKNSGLDFNDVVISDRRRRREIINCFFLSFSVCAKMRWDGWGKKKEKKL